MFEKFMPIFLFVVTIAVSGAVSFFLGMAYRKRVAEARIGSAEDESKRIINDAIRTAEQKRKEIVIEAKDEIFKIRNESEKELRDRRNEITRQERRLTQKEESYEKKVVQYERDNQSLMDRRKNLDDKINEIEEIKKSQSEELERISGLTESQAKDMLLEKLDGELTHEKALRIKSYEQQLSDESENIAREILSVAIARTAADHSSETTVSVVRSELFPTTR